jgi:hypothetical protein
LISHSFMAVRAVWRFALISRLHPQEPVHNLLPPSIMRGADEMLHNTYIHIVSNTLPMAEATRTYDLY